ncbi:MAG: proton-conducting transporter membrane subunit [Jatrophihabitantaceae bacterium]
MTGLGALLLLVVSVPLAAAVLAALASAQVGFAPTVGRVGPAAAGLSLGLSVAVAVVVFCPGAAPVAADLWPAAGGPAPLALVGDRVSVALLLLVCSVSTVVQVFARRYLTADPRAGWFTAAAGLLTAASAGLMCAATLLTFALCWSAAGVALWLLLGTYRRLPAARDGQARTARAFLLGDGALWLAVLLATDRFGTVSLRHADQTRVREQLSGHPATLGVIACLLVLAALSRSAQLPLHRWLPATLAAPTPVSALLHAGVVNAGGVLLVRLAPLIHPSAAASVLAVTAGGFTAAYAGVLMLTKPDIKGALTYSTMGQMGFMVLTAGLGLYAATLFHLIAHGLYKASLFLSSGTQTHRVLRRAGAPPAPRLGPARRAGALVLATVVPAAALASAQLLLPGGTRGASTGALLVFAWASAETALHAWLSRSATSRSTLIISAAIGVACALYVGLVHLFTTTLAPALPDDAPAGAAPWLLLGAALVLAWLSTLIRHAGSGSGLIARVHHSVYVNALAAGHVTPARTLRIIARLTPHRTTSSPRLDPVTAGGTP